MLAPLFAPERGPRIMMSATLAAGGSFAPIERACGITSARHLQLPSGFDYARQMRYFLPTPPLNPRDDEQGYLDETGRRLRELVIASSGRALILCTAFTQVEAMSEALRGIRYTVLVGDRFASPKALADAFRSDLHSVLIGTLRFWEGFDVPGEACSLVAIVRLPFERRDPLTEARYAAAEREGRSWFNDLALPDAMLMLRQGVGRGIRTSTDRAVVAILDGRIDLRQYGRAMLEALPRTAILRRVDAVAAFLASP